MTTKEHRKAIPLGIKLHTCLLLMGHSEEQIAASLRRRKPTYAWRVDNCLKILGFTPGDIAAGIQWDHQPALAFREIGPDGKMTPDPNDPRYLRPMRTAEHRKKTSGGPATSAGSDVHMAAKIKRITGETPKRPARKIRSRGFPKRR